MFFKKKKISISNEFSEDFPVLSKSIDGKAPIYFDNACMSLRPIQVVEAMSEYYLEHPSCARRSAHSFGKQTTQKVEQARSFLGKFFGAQSEKEVIFTQNTTEALNLVAKGLELKEGDGVVLSNMEHNSNLIPWMRLSEKKGIELHRFKITKEGGFDLNEIFELIKKPNVKIISVFSRSHILGISLPIKEISRVAKANNCLVLVDAAQSILHEPIHLYDWGVDFIATSFHKGLGPSGLGCLLMKEEQFENVFPLTLGGETVDKVSPNSYHLSESPHCYESGLQNYAGILGAAKACEYLNGLGYEFIHKKEKELSEYLFQKLSEISAVSLLGNKSANELANFHFGKMDCGELSILLDKNARVMVRSGVHCAHSWYVENKIDPSLRVSLAFYNTKSEIDTFVSALKEIASFYA